MEQLSAQNANGRHVNALQVEATDGLDLEALAEAIGQLLRPISLVIESVHDRVSETIPIDGAGSDRYVNSVADGGAGEGHEIVGAGGVVHASPIDRFLEG